MPKRKILQIQLSLAIFTLVAVLISGFFIFGPSLVDVAKALTGNYSKSTGESLTVSDWNNLDSDFLDKSGDTMTGDLTVPNLNVTGTCTGCGGGGGNIQILSGGLQNARVVCGRTGIDQWTYPFPLIDNITSINVDTSSANFTSDNVMYFTSIGGATQHFYTKGGSSIYAPDRNGFTLYLVYEWTEENFKTDQRAEEWGWFVNWCGIEVQ